MAVNGTIVTGFTFPTANTVQLGQTASSLSGLPVILFRQTQSVDPDETFIAGPLDPADMNNAFLQLLYIIQELSDGQVMLTNGDFSLLPTTLPSQSGVLWNDGGVAAFS